MEGIFVFSFLLKVRVKTTFFKKKNKKHVHGNKALEVFFLNPELNRRPMVM